MFIYLFFFEFSLSSVLAKKKKRDEKRDETNAQYARNSNTTFRPSPVPVRHACVKVGSLMGKWLAVVLGSVKVQRI